MLVPVLGVTFCVVTYPLVVAVTQSLTATRGGKFVGLANYQAGIENPLLHEALRQTAIYAAIVMPCEILLGLGLALLVHRKVRSPLVRLSLYLVAIMPIVIPPVAVGVVFRLIYAPSYGVLNHLLILARLVNKEINWLGQPHTAMLAVASVDIWQWTPFVYLVLFSGLQTVPRELVDAAKVDGADAWAQFWHIELPYLRPMLLLIVFFRLADVLRVFDHVFVLTGGGPGATTQFISIYLYRLAFRFTEAGEAAALAVLVMVSVSALYSVITRFLPLERG
jgi:multiple sugar transport system permease protein